MMMGISRAKLSLRKDLVNSTPVMPGIIQSSRIKSGR
jgi:hypothetical protein